MRSQREADVFSMFEFNIYFKVHFLVFDFFFLQDTGVSVRKRVIRILRDLCHEHPELPQLTDACVKMIRRVNDEEGIKVSGRFFRFGTPPYQFNVFVIKFWHFV